MTDLNKEWTEFSCPTCEYINDVQFVDIRLESKIICPNCKTIIELSDDDGSVHNTINEINNVLNNIENLFESF